MAARTGATVAAGAAPELAAAGVFGSTDVVTVMGVTVMPVTSPLIAFFCCDPFVPRAARVATRFTAAAAFCSAVWVRTAFGLSPKSARTSGALPYVAFTYSVSASIRARSAGMLKAFDPDDSPWDPDGGQTFFRHVGSIINGFAVNQRRKARSHRTILRTPEARGALRPRMNTPVDESLDTTQTNAALKQAGQTLLERLGPRDDVAIQVLAAARGGADTVEQQAAAIGCSTGEVRSAHRRLKYHASALIEEQRVADGQSIAELRERRERPSGKEVAG